MSERTNGQMGRLVNMKEYRSKLVRLMQQRLHAVENNDYEHNTPTFIWGAPGIGKSSILASICRDTWLEYKGSIADKDKELFKTFQKEMDRLRPWDASEWHKYNEKEKAMVALCPKAWVLQDVRLSQIDPVEIKGAPFYDIKNNKASFLRFSSILPDPDMKNPVYLFLDEFSLAPEMVQSAGYQLINDRKVGDYSLPEKCVVLAAGNQDCYGGVHTVMSPALEDRFSHLTLDIDYDGFIKYISKGEHSYDETMVAFLMFCKESEKQYIYKLDAGTGNFPTFRSWEKACRLVKYGEKEYDAISDSVGIAAASKFEIFKELTKDIPDASVLVSKKLYYSDVQMQLVASQKVGNQILNKELVSKLTDDKAFEYFRYFMEMKNPDDSTDNREELTILFLVNIRENLPALDKLNKGYIKALKAGTTPQEKKADGKLINNLFDLIFLKWASLSDI